MSAHNFQPWKFLVVTSEEGKEKVRQCYNRPWFANVLTFMITVDNGKTIEELRDENGKRVVFTKPAGALMYFISKGWELYSHGSYDCRLKMTGKTDGQL